MLTTLASVKTRLEIADASKDALLTMGIESVSARIARECRRVLERRVGHKQCFPAYDLGVSLEAYPVEEITSFEVQTAGGAGGFVKPAVEVSYLVTPGGVLQLDVPFGTARQLCWVTYTGGYVAPGGVVGPGQTALPRDLEQAVIEQVAFWYQQRAKVGVTRYETSPGFYEQVADTDLIPVVKNLVKKYRRVVL
jgi:hypothetical protein